MRSASCLSPHGLAVILLCIGTGGCGSTVGYTADPAATTATGGFKNPLDTVATSDGTKLYFTATNQSGQPAVYTVLAAGGNAVQIAAGAPLVSPNGIGISTDDQTLFIADTGAGLFKLAIPGGAPQSIAGTAANQPRGLNVFQVNGADVIYFTGTDPASNQGGVFTVPAAGGAITTVAKGAPLVTPVGITVASNGTIYVTNPVAFAPNSPAGSVLQIVGGVPTQVSGGLPLGYPAGLALTLDESTLVVSGLDSPMGHAAVYAINLTSKVLTTYTQGISDNTGAGGVHRALKFDIFGWAGSTLNGSGTVYRIQL